MAIKTHQNARIRLYDSASTPFYLELLLDDVGDFTGPLGAPLTEEILDLDRGNHNANALFREGNDEALMAPFPISFTVRLVDGTKTTDLRDWIRAMNDGGSTTCSGETLETCETDTQRDGSVANKGFADSNKLTCIVEYLVTMSGTDVGFTYNSVWFPADQVQISESGDSITMALNGLVYGTVVDITGFTAGTAIDA